MNLRTPVPAPPSAVRAEEPTAAESAHGERAGSTRALLVLLVLCVGSRVLSTVYYVEDTDSLRFALSMQEFSVAKLQPHFPGYPVFWAAARGLYEMLGSYAVAFSVIGGAAVFATIVFLLRLAHARLDSAPGVLIAALVFFNPLIWLMSNRYMPDLMGLAWAMAAFHFLVVSAETPARRSGGMFLAGMLAGVRLSYLPFLLVPVLAALVRGRERLPLLAAGMAGVLAWLLPFGLATGWAELVAAGRRQAVGHFTEFGGTVATEPELGQRVSGLLEGVLADGLGAFWIGRHPLALLVAAGLAVGLALGAGPLRRRVPARVGWIMAGSWGTYLVWIALYQNVVHKSRHVLPLLPFLLLAVALGCAVLWQRRRPAGRAFAAAFLTGYAALTSVLVVQHTRPTAIAQVAEALRAEPDPRLTVISIPLVNFYLAAQGIDARFVSVEDPGELAGLRRLSPDDRVVAVGRLPIELSGRLESRRVFFHNPYVNRMWSEIALYEYHGLTR